MTTPKHLLTIIAALVSLATVPVAFADEKSDKELEKTDLVESGTYDVTAHIVDSEEKELYVKTEDGKTLELYLTDSTKMMQGSETVDFSAFEEGQSLRIEVERDGDHMKPVSIEILDK